MKPEGTHFQNNGGIGHWNINHPLEGYGRPLETFPL